MGTLSLVCSTPACPGLMVVPGGGVKGVKGQGPEGVKGVGSGTHVNCACGASPSLGFAAAGFTS